MSENYYHCDHELIEMRLRTYANGTTHCVEQCQRCGKALRQYKKIASEVRRARATGPLLDFDETLRDKFYAKANLHRTSQRQEEKEAWWQWYDEYLCSDEWSRKRRLVLQRDDYTCQGCVTRQASRVHHLTYEHVGNEFLWQLVAVCQDCHDRLHEKDDNG